MPSEQPHGSRNIVETETRGDVQLVEKAARRPRVLRADQIRSDVERTVDVLADPLGHEHAACQASIPAVVGEDSTRIIVVLLVAKFLAYGVSLGCGFRGGPIFPAIFLGIALASLTVVWFDVSPTLAVSVGTAAGMAAQTRLIVTPVLLSTLLVGSQGLDTVPAAVLATASAWLAMALVDQRNEGATVATPPTPA